MKIKNKTIYSKDNYLIFNQVHFHKNNRKIIPFFYILILLMIYFAFFYFNDIFFRIVFILIALLIFIEVKSNFLPNMQVKQFFKTDKTYDGLINNYTFFEDRFEIDNKTGKGTIYYSNLYEVLETKDMLYLYINKLTAYLVDKNGFKKDQQQVIDTLKKSLKERYQIVKSN